MDSSILTPPLVQPESPRSTNVVRWLIALNVGVYVLQLTLVNPADVRALLGFAASDLDAWWTVVTYQFVHATAWPLALNMYLLWLFGSRVEAEWGSTQFAWYYALCGMGGWLFQLLFVREGVLIGSVGSVLAVMFAFASRWGNERVPVLGILPVQARWIVGVFILANLAAALTGVVDSGVLYLAHFGSLAAGWAYLRMAGSVDIDRLRHRVAQIADEPDDAPPRAIPPRTTPRKRERESRDVDEIVQQSQAAIAERRSAAPSRDTTRSVASHASSAELNALLDKISANGLDALTQSERDRLEAAARRLRDE